MQLGITMYTYQRYLDNCVMTMPEAIADAADAGFRQVDFIDLAPPEGVPILDYAGQIREICRSHGLTITSNTVHADFMNGCGGDAAKEAARVKGVLDVAAALGAKLFRHDAAWEYRAGRGNYKEAAKKIAPYIREVAEYGQSLGIKTMCENHGRYFQDSCRMEYLVEEVDHPNFGLLVDLGNFMCADEDPVAAVSRLACYAFHVHAKDFLLKDAAHSCPGDGWFPTRAGRWLRGTIVGHGVVPVRECVNILKNSGYDGCLCMEFEGLEDPRDAARAGYAYLNGLL